MGRVAKYNASNLLEEKTVSASQLGLKDFNCIVEFFSGLKMQRDLLKLKGSRSDETRTVIPFKPN